MDDHGISLNTPLLLSQKLDRNSRKTIQSILEVGYIWKISITESEKVYKESRRLQFSLAFGAIADTSLSDTWSILIKW